ncbi:prevent-host-death family protein [Arboricoccus pini]|uniref:Antitoxin n=1 Tax=Arboricoccus pini TaxID=1963835 RepID=A0A212RV76_9PROT|nr:type II toxin-antitoxin system prevent-host-death family antitoxin [Arboricoccus pini]SNB76630.1 prevent-host-death family protein [Arboricoccus pini]
MSKTISLRDANQSFAKCVREVESGTEFVITRNGNAVARLVPMGVRRMLTPRQQEALARTRARMTASRAGSVDTTFDRASLHER